MAIENCKHHYIIGPTKIRVDTAGPFLKAVDPTLYPDYLTIVQTPMDLSKISKNIKNNKYSIETMASASSAMLEILRDVDLIRNNCHAYNASPESADIRVMADALRNYFRYLLRVAIKIFQNFSEPSFVSYMIHLPEVEDFLSEETTVDVKTFLSISGIKIEDLVDKAGLLKQLGIKTITNEVRPILNDILAITEPEPIIPKITKATKSQKAPAEATKLQVKPQKRPLASISIDDVPEIPIPAPKSSGKAKGGQAKKRKLNSEESFDTSVYETSSLYDDDDAAAMFEGSGAVLSPGAAPTIARTTSTSNVLSLKSKLGWEEAADNILKTVGKHPYVDPLKATAAANFYDPVILIMPHLAEDYLRVISKPMDINTIRARLDGGAILDAQEFYEMLLQVFQNAIDYNAPHTESPYAMKLVEQCKHLINYCKWLCFESLPLQDDSTETNTDESFLKEYYGELRISLRDKARKEREDVVISGYFHELINNPFTECKKLLKDLERTSKKLESVQLSYFIAPVDVTLVTDYSVYVRSPMDLSTIKYKLDGTEPTVDWIANAINKLSPRYKKIGDFVQDLRRVFSNAKVFNKAHIDTDPTETSKLIYEAALIFDEKLEGLLPKFTLSLADRIECARIMNKELKEKEEADRLKRLQDKEEDKQIEQKLIEEYKKTDKLFALDQDIELKKKQTEKQLKAHVEAKKMAVVESSLAPKPTDEMLADDLSSPNMSPEISPTMPERMQEQIQIPSFIFGFGIAGQIPKRYQPVTDAKATLRRKAWDFFPVEVSNKSSTTAASLPPPQPV
jgi:hypothetical protein